VFAALALFAVNASTALTAPIVMLAASAFATIYALIAVRAYVMVFTITGDRSTRTVYI